MQQFTLNLTATINAESREALQQRIDNETPINLIERSEISVEIEPEPQPSLAQANAAIANLAEKFINDLGININDLQYGTKLHDAIEARKQLAAGPQHDTHSITSSLREQGCAVVCFSAEELNGASAKQVEERMTERGWEAIADSRAYLGLPPEDDE